jgi:hypothetical protein
MTELIEHVQIVMPEFCWLLIGLSVLWFSFRHRRFFVLIWRTLILILLVIASADPQCYQSIQNEREERVFAFDLSSSIPTSMREWMNSSTQGAL